MTIRSFAIRVARSSLRLLGSVTTASLALGLVAWSSVNAQQPRTATLVGRVIDAGSGAGVSDVGVQVVGTTLGTQSGIDGRYTIRGVAAGTLTIQARRIGFTPKTITGLQIEAGQTLQLDIALQAATVQLTAQVVTAASERGTVSEALDQQRTSTGVVNSVTREQIAKSPDGDAAQAVQRVSGVTVQDGKFVFVRGLGERYTTASLNGSRIPSPEPERKVVPLDLFPAGLLQSVTTSKTFTPDQPGDFSGAQVDIKTREFPASRQISYSMSTGMNSAATGRRLPYAPGVGGESFAMAGSSRDLPAALRAAGNLGTSSRRDLNQFINSFRNVWEAPTRDASPSKSLGATLGGSDPLFGHQIGYVASGTYSYSEEVHADEVRALANPGNTPGTTTEINRFEGTTGRSSVLWGGVLNLSTLIGTHSRLALNNTYDRTADNDARVERGSLETYGVPVMIQRMQYVERRVFSSQLSGEHELFRGSRFNWAATASGVGRREPDRSEFVQQIAQDPATGKERLEWFHSNEGAVRTFANLDEKSYEGRGEYLFDLGQAQQHHFKVGGLYRTTQRDADNRAYNIFAQTMSDSVRSLPPEQLFGGAFTAPDSLVLDLRPLGQGGSYSADDRLGAGFAMADVALGSRFRFVGGARLENWRLLVDGQSSLGRATHVVRDLNDLLPALALNVRLSDRQNLRFSASRTLARPEYREVTDISSRDVVNGVSVRGNPDLKRTLIDNYDVRWELYPRSSEVLSFGVFAKRFQDPIERVYTPSSNESLMTFVNAAGAENFGAELELRQGLDVLAVALSPLSVFTNITVMRSQIHLGESAAASTNPDRAMVGQAPYVVNGGMTYASRSGRTSATMLYNRVGPRITAAGENPRPDVREHPRDVLDFSLRLPLLRGVGARFDARNLLDARYLVTQGSVTTEAYRVGRTFQLGVNWQR